MRDQFSRHLGCVRSIARVALVCCPLSCTHEIQPTRPDAAPVAAGSALFVTACAQEAFSRHERQLVLSDVDLSNVDWRLVSADAAVGVLVLKSVKIDRAFAKWLSNQASIDGVWAYGTTNLGIILDSSELRDKLTFIGLSQTEFTTGSTDKLLTFKLLRHVNFSETNLNDSDALRIANCPRLSFLTIIDTPVTVSCMSRIRAEHPGLIFMADEWKAFESRQP